MHILHTEWSDGFGGQERRILAEAKGFAERGHRVTVATRESCWIKGEAQALGLGVVTFPMRGKFDLGTILPLRRYLIAERVDIVHTHSGIDAWIGAIAATLAGVPVVRTRHLFMPLKYSALNFVHLLTDRVLVLGDTMGKMLIADCGWPRAKVANVPTGIDFGRFHPRRDRASMRAEWGVAEDTFVVLTVGVIRGVKRHEVALRGFAEFHRRFPASAQVLAGDGPMRRDMEQLAQELGLAGTIRFLGHRSDVADLMGAADVMLLTSRSEAQSQALTQAIGLGLPVVATAVGGVPEVVIDGQTGLLVPPEDPSAVAEALERIASDPALATRLAEGGREHARRNYTLEVMLDRTAAVYAELLHGRTA